MKLDSLLLSAARLSASVKAVKAAKAESDAALRKAGLAEDCDAVRVTKEYAAADLETSESVSVRVTLPKSFPVFPAPLFAADAGTVYDAVSAILYGLEKAKKDNADMILREMTAAGIDSYAEPRFGVKATVVRKAVRKPRAEAVPTATSETRYTMTEAHTPLADAVRAVSMED